VDPRALRERQIQHVGAVKDARIAQDHEFDGVAAHGDRAQRNEGAMVTRAQMIRHRGDDLQRIAPRRTVRTWLPQPIVRRVAVNSSTKAVTM